MGTAFQEKSGFPSGGDISRPWWKYRAIRGKQQIQYYLY